MVTIVATLLFVSYLLFDPAQWLAKFMQLTEMTLDFKVFILILGLGYFVLAWVAEKYALPKLAGVIGKIFQRIKKVPKKRKEYKLVQERMRF